MKIKLSPIKELVYKTKDDLKKVKEEMKAEDARKLKVHEDVMSLDNPDPELINFAQMHLSTMTPEEEYKIIDEAIG